MMPTSEQQDFGTSGGSSALEVALGLAMAGAVCGLVAFAQSASGSTSTDDTRAGRPTPAVVERDAKSAPTANASNSMEVALLLRQRANTSALLDEAR